MALESASNKAAGGRFAHPSFVWIDCPVCEGRDFSQVLRFSPREFLQGKRREYYNLEPLGIDYDVPFHIQRCKGCGFVFVNPRFRPDLYEVVYNEAKVGKYDLDGTDVFSSDSALATLRHGSGSARVLLSLVTMALRHKADGAEGRMSVFDYGCGFGHTLRVAKSLGMEAWGVDLDQVRIQSCIDQGLNVMEPESFTRDHGDLRFDIVVSQDVLEHVDDLNGYLDYIARLCKPGALLHLNGLTPRTITVERRRGRWAKAVPFEHINYFTAATLDRLVAKHNFQRVKRIVDVRPVGRWLDLAVWPVKRHLPPGFRRSLLSAVYRYEGDGAD